MANENLDRRIEGGCTTAYLGKADTRGMTSEVIQKGMTGTMTNGSTGQPQPQATAPSAPPAPPPADE